MTAAALPTDTNWVDVSVCSVAHPVSVRLFVKTLHTVVKDALDSYENKDVLPADLQARLLTSIDSLASPFKQEIFAYKKDQINAILVDLINFLADKLPTYWAKGVSVSDQKTQKQFVKKFSQIVTRLEESLTQPRHYTWELSVERTLRSRPVLINLHSDQYAKLVEHAFEGVSGLRHMIQPNEVPLKYKGSSPKNPQWDVTNRNMLEMLIQRLSKTINHAFSNYQYPTYLGSVRSSLLEAVKMLGAGYAQDSLIFWHSGINSHLNAVLETLALMHTSRPSSPEEWKKIEDALSIRTQSITGLLGGLSSITDFGDNISAVFTIQNSGLINYLREEHPALTLDLDKYDALFTRRSRPGYEKSQNTDQRVQENTTSSPTLPEEAPTHSAGQTPAVPKQEEVNMEKFCEEFSPVLHSAYLTTETFIETVKKNDPTDEERQFLSTIRTEHYPAIAACLRKASALSVEQSQLDVFVKEAESQFNLLQEKLKRILDRSLRKVLDEMQAQTAVLRKLLEEDSD